MRVRVSLENKQKRKSGEETRSIERKKLKMTWAMRWGATSGSNLRRWRKASRLFKTFNSRWSSLLLSLLSLLRLEEEEDIVKDDSIVCRSRPWLSITSWASSYVRRQQDRITEHNQHVHRINVNIKRKRERLDQKLSFNIILQIR